MAPGLRIVQLSDTHITAVGVHPRGIDVRANFQSVLGQVRRAECDLLVLSGDLVSEKSHATAYDWIVAQVEALSIPTLVIAGNHDDVPRLADAFGLRDELVDGRLRPQCRRLDGITVYGLDTSAGFLAEDQILWLEESIVRDGQRPIVFMHHPPVDCECRFMDRVMPLADRDASWARLREISGVDRIFCGHYHTHKVVERDGIHVVICPSTELQISQTCEGFEVESERPGYLEIRAGPDEVTWEPYELHAGSHLGDVGSVLDCAVR